MTNHIILNVIGGVFHPISWGGEGKKIGAKVIELSQIIKIYSTVVVPYFPLMLPPSTARTFLYHILFGFSLSSPVSKVTESLLVATPLREVLLATLLSKLPIFSPYELTSPGVSSVS